ncbi:hypothetical protein [Halalkalibacter okhensis]|uniref:Spore cortex protein CoxA n=1 Tax=Halalkalibacter okhensis TaxID=333138 RepID=A0A0B0IE09_9BACI|nr:hypothetical protein [Halalkalibacter okhensis]KHF39127.1 hypothetical protein LQ50_16980 [Halalkalibacter okhensis]
MKKITMSVVAATMLVSGLTGCGVDNQATHPYETEHRQGTLGINDSPGIGTRNDLGGRVDHDGGFFTGQRHSPGEVEVGEDRSRGFGTDFGQGRAGGFFGIEGHRQERTQQGGSGVLAEKNHIDGAYDVQHNQTLQTARILEIDGVQEARVRGQVVELTVDEKVGERKARQIKQQAQKLAKNHTIRVVD